MKKFNIGDLVTSKNKYSDIFEKEAVYLGTIKGPSKTMYHVVGKTGDKPTSVFVEDKDIVLLAIANYVSVPKFHKRDKAFWKQRELIVVEERNEDLRYLCYEQETKALVLHSEKDLLTEKEFEKTLEENIQKVEVGEEN